MSKRVAAKRAAARGKRSKRDDDDQNEESFLSDMPEDGKLLSAAEIRSAVRCADLQDKSSCFFSLRKHFFF